MGDHTPQVTETRQKATPRWDFQLIRNGYNAEILNYDPLFCMHTPREIV